MYFLGHGDTLSRNVPTKLETLKDIQQISYGTCGERNICELFSSTFNPVVSINRVLAPNSEISRIYFFGDRS